MDDYKKHLYKRRSGMEDADAGDLSKQKAIRERLECKSFDWFMKKIAFDQGATVYNCKSLDLFL